MILAATVPKKPKLLFDNLHYDSNREDEGEDLMKI